MNTQIEIMIECTSSVGTDILKEINARQDKTSGRLIQRKNLDGNAGTWIVLATLTFNALPHVLTFISSKTTRKIKVNYKGNSIELENPTEEDVLMINEKFLKD